MKNCSGTCSAPSAVLTAAASWCTREPARKNADVFERRTVSAPIEAIVCAASPARRKPSDSSARAGNAAVLSMRVPWTTVVVEPEMRSAGRCAMSGSAMSARSATLLAAECARDFTIRVTALDVFALVIRLLTFCKRERQLDVAILQVQLEWHQ